MRSIYRSLVFVLTCFLCVEIAALEVIQDGITYEFGTENGNVTYHVLEVDPAKFNIELARVPTGERETVTVIAEQNGALAAINGGFFYITGPLANHPKGLLKINHHWYASQLKTYDAVGWSNDQSRILFDKIRSSEIGIHPRSFPFYTDESDWQAAAFIISGKSLLVKNNKPIQDFTDENIHPRIIFEKHPRTALGVKTNGCWIFVTVDGKRLERGTSPGMTLKELAMLMKQLGCRDAINMDGGGCTTMVIRGKIVNNHVGYEEDSDKNIIGYERKVPNAILIISK